MFWKSLKKQAFALLKTYEKGKNRGKNVKFWMFGEFLEQVDEE